MSQFIDVLQIAEVADLNILTDYITDNGAGRVSLDTDTCRRLVACKESGRYDLGDRGLIAKEIQAFGGNSLMNLFRGGGVRYGEIVCDVAAELKIKSSSTAAIDLEMAILEKFFADAYNRMAPDQQKILASELGIKHVPGGVNLALLIGAGRLGGFGTYKMSVIVANSVAKYLTGAGFSLVANATITRALSVMLGPIGWAVSGIWTMVDLAGPNYRVTIPCVIQIAYMRQKQLAKSKGYDTLQLHGGSKEFSHDAAKAIPKTKRATRKTAPKKTAATKSATRKITREKAAIKNSLTQKAAAKKTSANKSTKQKTAPKKSSPVKSATRKATTKKTATAKVAKKPGVRNAKKSTTRK